MESNVRYDVGEGFTAISADVESLLEELPANPVEICSVAQGSLSTQSWQEGSVFLLSDSTSARSVQPVRSSDSSRRTTTGPSIKNARSLAASWAPAETSR